MPSTPSAKPASTEGSIEALRAEARRRKARLELFDRDADGNPRPPEEVAELQKAERIRCKHDVFHWLDNYAWLENPKEKRAERRVFPLIMWERQRELVRFLTEGLETSSDRNINKAREIGVSWICCMVILHRFLFERGFKAKLGSRKEEYVDNRTTDGLFGKIRFCLDLQPLFLLPEVYRHEASRKQVDNYMRMLNPETGGEIIGESTNENFGRGGRRSLIFIDEDAHVPPRVQNAMHVALESVAASKWRVSTPNGRGNRFHTDYLMARKLANEGNDEAWANWLELDWHTDPRKTDGWYEALLRENGGTLTWDERAQEHDTSFAGVSGLRILKADRDAVEYGDEDLHPHAREHWLHLAVMDFGSGPSWTVCYWLLVNWDQDESDLPVIYVDAELVRQRTSAYEIGPEILEIGAQYTGLSIYTGDPAGANKESDQESWEERLRSTGVPISVLEGKYNDADTLHHNLRESQLMLDRGRLRIHRDRCPILLEAMESWEWDVPEGVPIELVNKATIHPKKNAWSHPGDAVFRYGVGAALRMDLKAAQQMARELEELPVEGLNALDEVLERLSSAGGGW